MTDTLHPHSRQRLVDDLTHMPTARLRSLMLTIRHSYDSGMTVPPGVLRKYFVTMPPLAEWKAIHKEVAKARLSKRNAKAYAASKLKAKKFKDARREYQREYMREYRAKLNARISARSKET